MGHVRCCRQFCGLRDLSQTPLRRLERPTQASMRSSLTVESENLFANLGVIHRRTAATGAVGDLFKSTFFPLTDSRQMAVEHPGDSTVTDTFCMKCKEKGQGNYDGSDGSAMLGFYSLLLGEDSGKVRPDLERRSPAIIQSFPNTDIEKKEQEKEQWHENSTNPSG